MKADRAPMTTPLSDPPVPDGLTPREARLWQNAWRRGYFAAERRLLGVSRHGRGGWIPAATRASAQALAVLAVLAVVAVLVRSMA